MTLPVTLSQLVLSKFLAAWVFTGIALALTFPLCGGRSTTRRPDNAWIGGELYRELVDGRRLPRARRVASRR